MTFESERSDEQPMVAILPTLRAATRAPSSPHSTTTTSPPPKAAPKHFVRKRHLPMSIIFALSIYMVTFNPASFFDALQDSSPTSIKGNPTEKDLPAPPGRVFDDIQEEMFQNAIAQEQEPRNQYERNKFSLNEWGLRSNGGLQDDDRLLLGNIYRSASSVFEFGLGESTRIAAHVGVPRYAGVDSDAVWVQKAREESNMTHFRFMFADIGETRFWGYPKDKFLKKIAYNYQIAPLAGELNPFDVYLVDGRYRVACACISLLHAIRHGGDMSKIMVAIHDYQEYERGYATFTEVATIVHKSSRLAVFKIKNTTRENDIRGLWEKKFNDQR